MFSKIALPALVLTSSFPLSRSLQNESTLANSLSVILFYLLVLDFSSLQVVDFVDYFRKLVSIGAVNGYNFLSLIFERINFPLNAEVPYANGYKHDVHKHCKACKDCGDNGFNCSHFRFPFCFS